MCRPCACRSPNRCHTRADAVVGPTRVTKGSCQWGCYVRGSTRCTAQGKGDELNASPLRWSRKMSKLVRPKSASHQKLGLLMQQRRIHVRKPGPWHLALDALQGTMRVMERTCLVSPARLTAHQCGGACSVWARGQGRDNRANMRRWGRCWPPPGRHHT